METPLVSVCMTTYNHEPYIAEAIESVLAQQTSFGVELVVGEDCSTDRTAAICREYAAKYPDRIRLVTSPENVGWRANYRRTFEACRGKYVAYLDGDDWWCDPRKLQMQADLMESDPGCGMCYTRASNYWQASDRTEPDHSDHYTDFGRLLCSLTICQLRDAGPPGVDRTVLRRGSSRGASRVEDRRRPDVALVLGAQPHQLSARHHGRPPAPARQREPQHGLPETDRLLRFADGHKPLVRRPLRLRAATASAFSGGAVRWLCGSFRGKVRSGNT